MFRNELLLIFFSILLFYQIEEYLVLLQTNSSVIENSIGYIMVFITFILLYFPKKISKFQIFVIISLAIIIRIKLLFILPVISTDLQRNLIFGSLFNGGWNPYLWTIQQIPELILNQGFIPKVNFTFQWLSHSYDYPILAVTFFSVITGLVPADNFSAYVLTKFVLIIIDSVNAYLIYRIIRDHFNNTELGKKIGLLYLLNPLSIFLVGMEGQFEPIPLFFVLLSFYLLFHRENENFIIRNYKINSLIPYFVGILLACGFLFKYFPIFYIPAIIFYFGRRFSDTISFLISFMFTSVILSLPVLFNSYYISNFLLFQLNRETNWFNGISYPFLGLDIPLLIIFMVMLISSIVFFYFQKDKISNTVAIGTLSLYIFIYFNPSMYSWYILWFYGNMLFIGIRNKEHHSPSLYDDILPSLYWVMSLSVLVVIWRPDMIILLFYIIIFSYIVTLTVLREKFKSIINNIFKKIPKFC